MIFHMLTMALARVLILPLSLVHSQRIGKKNSSPVLGIFTLRRILRSDIRRYHQWFGWRQGTQRVEVAFYRRRNYHSMLPHLTTLREILKLLRSSLPFSPFSFYLISHEQQVGSPKTRKISQLGDSRKILDKMTGLIASSRHSCMELSLLLKTLKHGFFLPQSTDSHPLVPSQLSFHQLSKVLVKMISQHSC